MSETMPMLTIDDPVLEAFAAEVGSEGPVAVEGARTRWDLGGPTSAGVRTVRAPAGIVDYVPDEMTVTVRCGTTVADLHAALAEKGQRTALPERSGSLGNGTVGGALAVGENSMHVLGRGRVREAALQVRYVSDDGKLITGGGPTVKNVTGFDLPRLLVGSLGTLGLLAEVILRTNPIPAVNRWLVSDDVDPFAILDTILRPSAVLWNGERTWVELEGHAPAVEAEAQRLATIGTWTDDSAGPELLPYRWTLAPAELRDTSRFAGESFVASIGVGTVLSSLAPPPPAVDPGVQALADRVKAQFDPRGRLNPGRMPGAAAGAR